MSEDTGTRNPYPGPRPFEPEERSIFAGRDFEIAELSSLVISHQVVLLYAQSGAGKTSLLNAGLGFGVQNSVFGRGVGLTREDIQLLPVARVGIPIPQDVPLDAVKNVYIFSAVGALLARVPEDEAWLRTATLVDALRRIPIQKNDAPDPVVRVIAFDQFEELFSTFPERWRDRTDFISQVDEALQGDSCLRVLFVLREDYLASFGDLVGPLPEGARTRYHLERLRESEALFAVKQPLEGTQWEFPDDLAESLVQNLMTTTVVDSSGKAVNVPGEYVEPVQLQVVCRNLIENLGPNEIKITKEHLEKFGNPDGALQRFYEEVLRFALKKPGIDEGKLRSWFEENLITPAGTRGLVFQDRDQNMTAGIPNDVVDVLESQHLIRPEIRSGSRWYELTHDRLIRPIQKSNRAYWELNGFDAQFAAAVQKVAEEKGASKDLLMNLLNSLLPKNEQAHLVNLAKKRTAGYRGNHALRSEIRRLRSLGLISMRGDQQVRYMKDGTAFDLAGYVKLTEPGEGWARTIQEGKAKAIK
jgi:hypothetical protein